MKITVEVWSDIFCPFCYIGKSKFESALEKFSRKEEVEVIYKSFELNPNSQKSQDGDIHSIIASKYGVSYEQAKMNNDNIVEQAALAGLTFNFDTLVPTNSFDAHRMIHFAAKYGKMKEMTEALFAAYFTDSKNVSDKETLANIAVVIGLDKEEALKALNSDAYGKEVRADEEEGSKLGVNSVPFFVFNRKFAVSGAQSPEAFLSVLEKAFEDEEILNDVNEEKDEEDTEDRCAGGTCKI